MTTSITTSTIEQTHDFYCTPRSTSIGELSRYQIWERGEAFNDSITPSTYCPEYRTHMELKISSLAKPQGRIFSIGCGNAFVESDLVANGFYVEAIDYHTEAVELATLKGVEASAKDYYDLPAEHFFTFDAIYADGLLGHLYRPENGLNRFFEKFLALKPRSGTWLILSNDAPLKSGSSVAPNKHVNGFWLLSRAYIAESLERFGFEIWESYYFPYLRPMTGLRNRTICIARFTGNNQLGE